MNHCPCLFVIKLDYTKCNNKMYFIKIQALQMIVLSKKYMARD